MNVVDSSGWLEYLADAPNASFFATAVEETEALVVPSLSVYEVFKRILQQRTESEALTAVALMVQARVADLTAPLAIAAAKLSLEEDLPMADIVMLATARAHDATLWTQDADFEGLAGVEYCPSAV